MSGPFPSDEVTVELLKDLVQGLVAAEDAEPTVESSVPFDNDDCKVVDPDRVRVAQQRYQGQVVEIKFKETGKGVAVMNCNMDTFDLEDATWKVVAYLDPSTLEQ